MAWGLDHRTHRFRLPRRLLVTITAANIAYSATAASLASRPGRTRTSVRAMATANAVWGFVCIGLVLRRRRTASAAGLLHLVGEAVLVGILAAAEFRSVDVLAPAPASDRSSET